MSADTQDSHVIIPGHLVITLDSFATCSRSLAATRDHSWSSATHRSPAITRDHSKFIHDSFTTLTIKHASFLITRDPFVIIRGSLATHSKSFTIHSQPTQDRVRHTHCHPQPLTITGDHSRFLQDHHRSPTTQSRLSLQTCSPKLNNLKANRIAFPSHIMCVRII